MSPVNLSSVTIVDSTKSRPSGKFEIRACWNRVMIEITTPNREVSAPATAHLKVDRVLKKLLSEL